MKESMTVQVFCNVNLYKGSEQTTNFYIILLYSKSPCYPKVHFYTYMLSSDV